MTLTRLPLVRRRPRRLRHPLIATVAVAALSCTVMLSTATTPAMAQVAGGDAKLSSGEVLASGTALVSRNGDYQLVMQGDGNLVLYKIAGAVALWSTKTYGHPGAFAAMQKDGNFVLYAGGKALWSTGTYTYPGSSLKLRSSGNAVLYSSTGVQIWSTDTGGGYVVHDRDDIAEVKSVAHRMAIDRGWTSDAEFSCLSQLWDRESGWRWNADNPYSQAYGIPQANPGSKMSEAGADWHENPVTQIKWGFSYIAERYGTPCGAWSFWQSHGWYAAGD